MDAIFHAKLVVLDSGGYNIDMYILGRPSVPSRPRPFLYFQLAYAPLSGLCLEIPAVSFIFCPLSIPKKFRVRPFSNQLQIIFFNLHFILFFFRF